MQTKEEDDSIARATAYTALDLPKSVTKGESFNW